MQLIEQPVFMENENCISCFSTILCTVTLPPHAATNHPSGSNQQNILTTKGYVTHCWLQGTECRIWWPTWTGVLWGIRGRMGLGWCLTALRAAPSESPSG